MVRVGISILDVKISTKWPVRDVWLWDSDCADHGRRRRTRVTTAQRAVLAALVYNGRVDTAYPTTLRQHTKATEPQTPHYHEVDHPTVLRGTAARQTRMIHIAAPPR